MRYFWSQTQAFSQFHKILQLDKFKSDDLKNDNIVFKVQSKKRHFWSKIQEFLFFFTKLRSQTKPRVLISNITIWYSNFSSNIPKKGTSGPKFRLFCFFFCKILQLGKFKGVYFKYDNSFFKILTKKIPNEKFLVANFGIFII